MRQWAGNDQVGDQTGSLRGVRVSGIIFAKTENRFRMKVKVEKKEGAGSAARSPRFFFVVTLAKTDVGTRRESRHLCSIAPNEVFLPRTGPGWVSISIIDSRKAG